MSEQFENSLTEAHEAFNRDHQALRETLMKALPKSPSRPGPPGSAARLWRLVGGRTSTARIARTAAAAAAVIVAVMAGTRWFDASLDGVSVALASMRKAVDAAPLVHELLYTTHDDGKYYETEKWYYFQSRKVLSKYSVAGKCFKISSLDYNTMKNVVYDPNSDLVRISYRLDVHAGGLPPSAWSIVDRRVQDFDRQGASVVRRKAMYEATPVDMYSFCIPSNFRGDKVEAELLVDSATHLPIIYKRKAWACDGRPRFDQIIQFDFPEDGPHDIYDLGVPQSTAVVYDSASKKLLEKKISLLAERDACREQDQQIYRLKEGQVLKHVVPALVESRARVRAIDRLIDQLKSGATPQEHPGDLQKDYAILQWDGGLTRRPIGVFSGEISLKTALEKIVGLSRFEYDIADGLSAIRFPGDWVIRKGTPKEQLLGAFQKAVQQYPQGNIRFDQYAIEGDVIVVSGTFRLTPLAGTYECSRIHVFSDKLDVDERGGGGSGSLDSFIRGLGDILLDQHVIGEVENSADIEVRYGWHESGYLWKITDKTDKSRKLDMLLANLARQTGLKFERQRRLVNVWFVHGQ